MKCHYEVLNISQEADLPEIKSAYRKAALKWHPDKNLNNVDDAKEQFQLVQQAYEVLSDPQERAWYDKHRHQILYGAGSEYEDDSLDVFPYFTSTCFKGYTDDPGSFYAVYGEVFDKVIEEDLHFCEDKEEFCDIPRFGKSTSDYDEVVAPFYAYWLSYSTKKTYVWLDKYEADSGTERRIFKLMEKENKKIRQKAKKERNDEIRNLVAFVRKRDRRVQQHTKLLEQKKLENREKHKELSKKHRLNRKQELDQSGAEAEWAKFDNVQSQLEEIEKKILQEFQDDDSKSEDEEEASANSFYCVACNKVFKTVKAFENHETSKKHKEKVVLLTEIMQEEDGEDESVIEEEEISDMDVLSELLSESNSESDSKKTKKQKKKKKKALKVEITVTDDEDEIEKKISIEVDDKLKEENEELTTNEPIVEVEDANSSNIPEKRKKKPKKVGENGQISDNNKKKKQRNKRGNKQEVDDDIDTSHVCVTCKSNFPSKNKLFDHLKKTGHGVYLPKSGSKGNKSK